MKAVKNRYSNAILHPTAGGGPATWFDQGETFSAKRDAKSGRAVLAVFGDSTGAISTRWPRRLCTSLAADNTDAAVGYSVWNDTTQANDPRVSVAAGTGGSSSGTVVSDAFAHNSGSDLKGTTSDTGQSWGGFANGAGNWTLNGSKIARAAGVSANSPITVDSGVTGDRTVTLTGVSLNTVGQTAAATLRVYAGQVDSSNQVYLFMGVSTTGLVTWGLSKNVAGSTSTLAVGGASGLTNNSATIATFNISLAIVGTTVTGTLNGATATGTLTSGEAAAIASGSTDGFLGNQPLGQLGCVIDAFDVYATHVGSPTLDIEMYNGSMSGSVLTYQQPRLAQMCPETPDLVVINSAHNYGTGTPTTYLAALDSFITAVTAQWPTAGIVVMSQNPEKPGTLGPNVAAHQARNIALRAYCAKKGVGYIPVFEAFRKRADLGVSYVRADGVHPTDTTDNADPNGASLWTGVVYSWLTAKRLGA